MLQQLSVTLKGFTQIMQIKRVLSPNLCRIYTIVTNQVLPAASRAFRNACCGRRQSHHSLCNSVITCRINVNNGQHALLYCLCEQPLVHTSAGLSDNLANRSTKQTLLLSQCVVHTTLHTVYHASDTAGGPGGTQYQQAMVKPGHEQEHDITLSQGESSCEYESSCE
jgi:hypothetical protein